MHTCFFCQEMLAIMMWVHIITVVLPVSKILNRTIQHWGFSKFHLLFSKDCSSVHLVQIKTQIDQISYF